MKGRYDQDTISKMRKLLDELLLDQRFTIQKRMSALEIAEHILSLAASGERDIHSIRSSVLRALSEKNAA